MEAIGLESTKDRLKLSRHGGTGTIPDKYVHVGRLELFGIICSNPILHHDHVPRKQMGQGLLAVDSGIRGLIESTGLFSWPDQELLTGWRLGMVVGALVPTFKQSMYSCSFSTLSLSSSEAYKMAF